MAQFPIDIKIDTGEARKLTPLNRELDRTDQSATGATTAVKALGAAFVTLGGAAVVSRAIRVNTDFNRSISELSAITGATGRDLQFLTQASKEFGATTTLSASQAATAFKLIASAKPDLLTNVEALRAVTREAIALAEAAGIDLPAAADSLGNALNQFGAQADQASRFINVLAAGAKFGSSSIQDTSNALRDAGVSAANANVSFEETNAAIQALATAGLRGSRAGTALRNVITILDTSANEQLRPSVVGLTQALGTLADQQLDTTEFVKLFGRENQNAARILLNQRDNLRGLTQALTGTNTAYEQAATRTDNLAGDLLALRSAFEGVQIESAQLADSGLRDLTQALTSGLQDLNENPEKIAEAISTVGDVATAVGAILAGRFVTSVTASTTALVKKTAATIADNNAARQSAAATASAATAELAYLRTVQQSLAASVAAAQSERTRTALRQQLAANTVQLTAATNAYNAALLNQTRIATTATTVMGGLRGAMGFLGGPTGVILLAATALFAFGERTESAEDRARRLAGEVDKLGDSFANLTRGELIGKEQEALKNVFDTQQQINALVERRQNAQLNIADPSRVTSDTREYAQTVLNARATVEQLGVEIAALQEKQERERALVGEISQARKDATAALLNQKIAQQELAEAQATEQFEKVRTALQDQVFELENGARAYELYRAAREAGIELGSAEAQSLDQLITKREQLTAALDITALEDQLEALRLTGEQQAIYNATAGLSVDVTEQQRQRIIELTSAIYQQNEALAAQRALEQFDESTETPAERIAREAEEIREANRIAFEAQIADERLSQEQRLSLIDEFKAREIAITEKTEAEKRKIQAESTSKVRQATAQGLDAVAGIIAAAGGKQTAAYRVAFAASRAFALADSIAKISQAQAQALADPSAVTLPQKIANYAAVASAGASLISSLKEPAGFADGGFVSGAGTGRSDSIPAWLSNGEFVMPATRTDQYRSELEAMRRGSFNGGGRSGGVTIINNVSDRVDVTTAEGPDGDLIATIDERIAERTPGIVADSLSDPYSDSTKSLESRYRLERN